MELTWEARFAVFAAISFASVAFGGIAIYSLRDDEVADGMFFNRVKEIITVFPVLKWGMAVPLVAALALTTADLFVGAWSLPAAAGLLFLVSFASLNYIIICGSMKLLGWR